MRLVTGDDRWEWVAPPVMASRSVGERTAGTPADAREVQCNGAAEAGATADGVFKRAPAADRVNSDGEQPAHATGDHSRAEATVLT